VLASPSSGFSHLRTCGQQTGTGAGNVRLAAEMVASQVHRLLILTSRNRHAGKCWHPSSKPGQHRQAALYDPNGTTVRLLPTNAPARLLSAKPLPSGGSSPAAPFSGPSRSSRRKARGNTLRGIEPGADFRAAPALLVDRRARGHHFVSGRPRALETIAASISRPSCNWSRQPRAFFDKRITPSARRRSVTTNWSADQSVQPYARPDPGPGTGSTDSAERLRLALDAGADADLGVARRVQPAGLGRCSFAATGA